MSSPEERSHQLPNPAKFFRDVFDDDVAARPYMLKPEPQRIQIGMNRMQPIIDEQVHGVPIDCPL